VLILGPAPDEAQSTGISSVQRRSLWSAPRFS